MRKERLKLVGAVTLLVVAAGLIGAQFIDWSGATTVIPGAVEVVEAPNPTAKPVAGLKPREPIPVGKVESQVERPAAGAVKPPK